MTAGDNRRVRPDSSVTLSDLVTQVANHLEDRVEDGALRAYERLMKRLAEGEGPDGSRETRTAYSGSGAVRSALLVTHTGRRQNVQHAQTMARDLVAAGFEVRVLAEEVDDLELPPGVKLVDGLTAAENVEIVVALGGDGTFLRAAELARPMKAPLLGIDRGHGGFLAGADVPDIHEAVRDVIAGDYRVDERLTLDVRAEYDGRLIAQSWALNEVSIEKGQRSQMLELMVDVDGHPLSRYGCDGVVCATPTGSTAHAFSAGGPVLWPEVEALLLVPISAHALFSKPIVTAPTSTFALTIDPYTSFAVMCCDGRRTWDLPPGAKVTVQRGELPIRLVQLSPRPFTDTLVAKFQLPVVGWRRDRS